ncbi:MAG: pseudouridine synthase [Sediminibacterium sp.]|jgi:23S rRNA pseudouridine2457 synthase|nr:pseudouridine synthase [Sediminibacterium sp.]MBP6145279.1 pseudouridine synthase [Sediminibacterium sp.]
MDYFLIYKPFQVLSQFTSTEGKLCLKDILHVPTDVYPVGRLDYDSEGLLLITNDKSINQQLLNPIFAHQRTYWVQVDGAITPSALAQLTKGVTINIDGKAYKTKPAKLELLPDSVQVPDRNPPIRFRKNIPTSWVAIQVTEGKNRQVRKMFAQVGFPVLRLIRAKLGKYTIQDMQPGDCLSLTAAEVQQGFFR